MLYTFAFYFARNVNWVKIDLCCAEVCAFLSMLMRVKHLHGVMKQIGTRKLHLHANVSKKVILHNLSHLLALRPQSTIFVNAYCHILT